MFLQIIQDLFSPSFWNIYLKIKEIAILIWLKFKQESIILAHNFFKNSIKRKDNNIYLFQFSL
jgi:hypothetical protein